LPSLLRQAQVSILIDGNDLAADTSSVAAHWPGASAEAEYVMFSWLQIAKGRNDLQSHIPNRQMIYDRAPKMLSISGMPHPHSQTHTEPTLST